jgi:ABC-type dipeptide/oligopeptide/nickel transport system permease subunit
VSEAKLERLNAPLQLQERVRPHRTLWQDATRRFFRNRLAVVGFTVVVIFLILAIFANWIAPYDYRDTDFTKVLLFPFEDPAHILGTDEQGRDLLSRLIFGARTSMIVGLSVQTFAVVVGVTLGGFAGYAGRCYVRALRPASRDLRPPYASPGLNR